MDDVTFYIFQMMLTSEVICKQWLLYEKRLHNIFKTINAMTCTKAFRKAPTKLYQDYKKDLPWKRSIL